MAAIPIWLFSNKVRRTALADFLTRRFGEVVKEASGDVQAEGDGWHEVKGGAITVDRPGQHVSNNWCPVLSLE